MTNEIDEILGRMLDRDAPTVKRTLSVIDECIGTVDANIELLKHEAARQQEVAKARAEREQAAKEEREAARALRRNHVRGLIEKRDANRKALSR